MADIAERLHTSRPNIYTYYASTEAILDVLLDSLTRAWIKRLDEMHAAPLNGETDYPAGSMRDTVLALAEHRDLLLLLHSGGGPGFYERRARVYRDLEAHIVRSLPPELLARWPHAPLTIRALVISTVYELVQGDDPDIGSAADLIEHVILSSFGEPLTGQRAQAGKGNRKAAPASTKVEKANGGAKKELAAVGAGCARPGSATAQAPTPASKNAR